MYKKTMIFLIFFYFHNIYSQENFTIFTGTENIVNKDIIIAKDGIWLYIDDYNSFKSKIIKVNQANEIIIEGPQFDMLTEWKDVRWHPGFLGVDNSNNIYFYNLNSAIQDSSSISIYKLDSNGKILWEQIVDSKGVFEIISQAEIINDEIICVGMAFDFNEETFVSFAISLFLNNGAVKWEKSYQFNNISVFADIVSTSSGLPIILQTGVDLEEIYYSRIIILDTLGNIIYNEIISNDFFGNRIEVLNEKEFLISGYGDEANLINFDINSKSIVFKKIIDNVWDDVDIPVFKIDDKIITLNTTIADSEIVPGSGIELMVNVFDLNGSLLDSVFYDYDDTFETILWNAVKSHDNKIYFCGVLNLNDFQNSEIKDIWGYFDSNTLSLNHQPFLNNEKLILFPSIVNCGEKVFFNSKFQISSSKIIDINGKIISSLKINNKFNNFKTPLVPSGLYNVIFQTGNRKQVGKIIIK